MSKFRVRLKIEGFELEIEGNREDAGIIGRNIGEQISGMIAPGMSVVEGNVTENGNKLPSISSIEAPRRKPSKRAPRSVNAGSTSDAAPVIQFQNDAKKYASPTQSWNTLNKALWLLYVASKETSAKELTAGQITQCFNAQFRQAKIIKASNVSRDLGKVKISNPSLAGEIPASNPSKWFLTEEGEKVVQQLIADTLNPKTE